MWKQMETSGKLWKTVENMSKTMEKCGNIWKTKEKYEKCGKMLGLVSLVGKNVISPGLSFGNQTWLAGRYII